MLFFSLSKWRISRVVVYPSRTVSLSLRENRETCCHYKSETGGGDGANWMGRNCNVQVVTGMKAPPFQLKEPIVVRFYCWFEMMLLKYWWTDPLSLQSRINEWRMPFKFLYLNWGSKTDAELQLKSNWKINSNLYDIFWGKCWLTKYIRHNNDKINCNT